eukprot:gene36656-14422_t
MGVGFGVDMASATDFVLAHQRASPAAVDCSSMGGFAKPTLDATQDVQLVSAVSPAQGTGQTITVRRRLATGDAADADLSGKSDADVIVAYGDVSPADGELPSAAQKHAAGTKWQVSVNLRAGCGGPIYY